MKYILFFLFLFFFRWDVQLQYDYLEAERLKLLLEEEKNLMTNDYPLASIATIRDAFFGRAFEIFYCFSLLFK